MSWFKKKTKNSLPTSEDLRAIHLREKQHRLGDALKQLNGTLRDGASHESTFEINIPTEFESDLLILLAKHNITVNLDSRYQYTLGDATDKMIRGQFYVLGKVRYKVTI